MDNPDSLSKFVYMLAVALSGSGTGRIVWHMMEVKSGRRKCLSWAIGLELAIAVMMALLAVGIADYNEWSREVLAAVACGLGYLGPKGLEFWARWYIETRRGKDGKKDGT